MKTVKVRTSQLVGAALDWAVADVIGLERPDFGDTEPFHPSTVWAHCGPLIEKFQISFGCHELVHAYLYPKSNDINGASSHGKTHLIAACLAIVKSHLPDGVDVVEVPEDLVKDGEL